MGLIRVTLSVLGMPLRRQKQPPSAAMKRFAVDCIGELVEALNYLIIKPMELNKRELKRIRQALRIAIDSENDFIDAHRIGSYTKGGKYKGHRIPDEFKPIIESSKRTIAAFRKILDKINT